MERDYTWSVDKSINFMFLSRRFIVDAHELQRLYFFGYNAIYLK